MKKLVLGAVSLVLGTGLLAGCSGDNKTAQAASGGGNAKEITISVRESTWGARKDNFIEAEKRLNEELKADGVQVKIDWWPGIGDDELILQAQAGKVADIFMNSSVDIGWELNAGIIREIDWVKDSEVFKNVPESYTNIMKYEGHYYGAIQDMDASPVFISRKALEGLGWTKPEIDGLRERVEAGDFTFGDLEQLAEQAKQKNLVKMGFAVEDTRFEGWNYAFGNYNYNAEQNKMVLTSKTRDVYDFWADALSRGIIDKSIGEIGTDKAAPMFVKGEIFAEFARTEFYQLMREAKGMQEDTEGFDKWFNENVVWIPIPSAEKGGKPVSYSNPAMIYVGPSVDDEKMPYVQKLIEHVLDPDLQINHTLVSGKLPVTPEAQADERFKKMAFYKDHAYLLELTRTRPAQPDYATYVKAYVLGVDAILTKGQTAEQAYELFRKDAQQNVPSDRLLIEP